MSLQLIYGIELNTPTPSSKIDFAGGATLSSSTYAIHSILQRHTSKLLHSTLIPPLLKNSKPLEMHNHYPSAGAV
jgi:hypothetical protein